VMALAVRESGCCLAGQDTGQAVTGLVLVVLWCSGLLWVALACTADAGSVVRGFALTH